MKSKSFFNLFFLLLIFSSFSVMGQKSSFTGAWKLDKEKTVLADNQLFLSKVTVQLKNDSLLTTRVYENGNGEEYPFDENLSLNGKESKIYIYDMPRTSKAMRPNAGGALIFESTTVFQGDNGSENLIAKETWQVDTEGKTLTISFTNKMAGVETTGKSIFNKAN